MERLTTRNIAGVAVYKYPFECERCGETIWRLPDYGNGSPTEKLADYEDAEEQGLFLRLPCKVGDTVYKPNPITKKGIVEIKIESIFITESGINISGSTTIKKYLFCCQPDDFGKTVFLTSKKAEAKLAEMEGAE